MPAVSLVLLVLFAGIATTACRPVTSVALPRTATARLWSRPADVVRQDLFYGPWGADTAPDPAALYTEIERKHSGVNPGVTVRDAAGREWSVKLAPVEQRDMPEGPIEVTLSRVLSGLGYLQPPAYYLPSFKMTGDWGVREMPAGRFRLKDKSIKEVGTWSLDRNPFDTSVELRGLLVILMLFNSSDLKDDNNSIYERRYPDGRTEAWYLVRDLGTALGSTGRMAPLRGDLSAFRQNKFITGVRDGFVEFDYHGRHQELFRRRITPADVGWACALAGELSDRQWRDAFRAGGHDPSTTLAFMTALTARITLGQMVAATGRVPETGR
jgi:hypothetical protein